MLSHEPLRRDPVPVTIPAYATDWRDFTEWCGRVGRDALPATPATIGAYLAMGDRQAWQGEFRRVSRLIRDAETFQSQCRPRDVFRDRSGRRIFSHDRFISPRSVTNVGKGGHIALEQALFNLRVDDVSYELDCIKGRCAVAIYVSPRRTIQRRSRRSIHLWRR
jgi:hypothetical protein